MKKTTTLSLFTLLFIVQSLFANEDGSTRTRLEDLKMQKRFGIGLAAAGGLSVLGIEADFNLSEVISISGGIGTGLDYSTFAVKAKYYLLGESVSPYFAAGVARWWTNGTREKNIGPSVLVNNFLETRDYTDGFSIWILYPAVGVQFFSAMGVSVYAEVQYLFKVFNFANGTYAGLGAYWYF